MGKTLMMFGVGDLGGWVLEFLARREGLGTIIACDVREHWGTMKVDCAASGAGQEGYCKTMKFEKCDVNDTDRTAELIKKYSPDVIYSGLTLCGWIPLRVIPEAVGPKYDKATVILASINVPLLHKLMQALKKSGVNAQVVNNAYPDIVNPILCKSGFPVLVGGGNLDIIVGDIRRKISVTENVPIREVTIYLIAEHCINALGTRTGAPYFFKVMVGDRNITSKVDVDSLISDGGVLKSPIGQESWLSHPAIAASAVRNIMAMINDTNEFAHAPGPNGLPGGYPIRINAKGVEIVLPEEITMEQAIKINSDGMKCEGAEEIKDDGTLVFTDEAAQICKETYGLGLKEMRFADMEDVSKEVLSAFKKLVEKYK
jgi:hypothetical protein